MNRGSLFLIAALLAVVLTGCGDETSRDGVEETATEAARQAPGTTEVRIDGAIIRAELAITAEERSRGLSGRESMPEDAGMLFVLGDERIPSFTMREMQFPLDFVWIDADGRVVDVTPDVPNPEGGAAPVSSIRPSRVVAYVLEVNAGVIETLDIEIGDEVTFSPEVSPEDAS